MRELVIARLNEIKSNYGFSQGLMRWAHKSLPVRGVDTPIQEVNFSEMTDVELMKAFEWVTRQHYKQM